LPPRVQTLGRRRAIFPVDPQGGGTWVGVNDRGLVVSLLNVHSLTSPRARGRLRSRGVIVNALLRCRTLVNAAETVTGLDPSTFQRFCVVMVHDGQIAVATSIGGDQIDCSLEPLCAPRLFTSSSLGDEIVEAPRRRLFDRLVVQSRSGWLPGQARFHDHQWSRRPEISVRMERHDARTVSRTTIDITGGIPRLLYETHP
jgi:hypothetical protein